MKHIAILDFGSQYTHLISRRIRELKVLAKIYPSNIKAKNLSKEVVGIILSGGPQSVYAKQSLKVDKNIFKIEKPILGLCYGHQLMAKNLGGQVKKGKIHEYGPAKLKIVNNSELLKGVKNRKTVWMSHGDSVIKLPQGFTKDGQTSDCPITAMSNVEQNFYGLQFHPEVHHTEEGKKILENFVLKVCKAKQNWQIKNILKDIIGDIKKQVRARKVFLLVSGGVDSSVCFALLEKALGKNKVYGLYIDTGLMRQNESKEIKKFLAKAGFDNLHTMDAGQLFLNNLKSVIDPEEKRKIIGQTFLKAKNQASKKLNTTNWMLGQGTIYPDTIETGGTKHSDTIKTHHNRVAAIEKLIKKGLVIEPLARFYKDEVREIGRLLELPEKLISRHPFPGPGLAIRILCSDSKDEKLPNFKNNRFKSAVLPIKSVGVQGDNRTYAHPLAIWNLKQNSWNYIDKISSVITNSSKSINRVLLLLNTNKQNLFLKIKNQTITKNRINTLREIDDFVKKETKKNNLEKKIWQFPVVLVPIGKNNLESIVLRPIISEEAMTARFARLNTKFLQNLSKAIISKWPISYVFYDITNKPPGTIEWE